MNKDISQLLKASILFLFPLIFIHPALAQNITSDKTVPTEVNTSGNVTEITGGAKKGNNLFHSFEKFSVLTNTEAFFNIENNLNIENIISRVTGGSLSNIDGLIRANGSANLFLLNPAGILFGRNASLNIGGSFYGSTADSLLFDDGVEFSAVNPQNPSLTVNAPIGLRFRDNPAPITYRSLAFNPAFAVKSNQTLAFVGGDIRIEDSFLIVDPGGRIDLGGLSAAGTVEIDKSGSLKFPDGITRADIFLAGSSVLINETGESGGISINARNLTLSASEGFPSAIGAFNTISPQQRDKALISINASEKVSLTEQSAIIAQLTGDGVGKVKGIEINTSSLEINSSVPPGENPAQISVFADTSAIVQDNVDILTINASERISINQGAIQSRVTTGGGQRGNISIATGSFELTNNASVFLNNISPSNEVADTGKLSINADRVLVDNSELSTALGANATANNGTNLEITAKSVEVVNSGNINAKTIGVGDAASVIIDTEQLKVQSNSEISVSSEGGGRAGELIINANSVDLNRGTLTASTEAESGGNINLIVDDKITLSNSSQITAEAKGNADGGAIDIETEQLTVQSNSKIIASATGEGSGGKVKINAESLNLNGGTIAAETASGTGGNITLDIDDETSLRNNSQITAEASGIADGGRVNIETERLIVKSNSKITASATGEGSGGEVKIEAESLTLNRGTIEAETAANTGGNINLDIDDTIILENNSLISAAATGTANGGNINIDTDFIIAVPNRNSDILASAGQEGAGGRIVIDAEGIFGIEERPQNPITNDIDASGGTDGEVIINTPDVDISKGVIETPQRVVAPEQIVARACSPDGIARGSSSLIVNGKGGVPPKPTAPISSDTIYLEGDRADIRNTKRKEQQEIVSLLESSKPVTINDIIPARGAIILENGDVILTAYPTPNSGYRSAYSRANCS